MRLDFMPLTENDLAFVLAPSLVLVAVALVIWWRSRAAVQSEHPVACVERDWLPTGAINFLDDSGSYDRGARGRWYLEVEEDRVVTLIGGGSTREVRHRLATLNEAVMVVRAYRAAPPEMHVMGDPC